MFPQWPDFVLSAYIPDGECDVFVLYRVNVETYFILHINLSVSISFWNSPSSRQFVYFLPIVGIVGMISPSLSLNRIVVLPAPSRPSIRIRISFLLNKFAKRLAKMLPISMKSCLSNDYIKFKINIGRF